MCGIVGFKEPLSMVETLDHRGPDVAGFHRDRNRFGHKRLTLSPNGGSQPRVDITGDVLVYNGERD